MFLCFLLALVCVFRRKAFWPCDVSLFARILEQLNTPLFVCVRARLACVMHLHGDDAGEKPIYEGSIHCARSSVQAEGEGAYILYALSCVVGVQQVNDSFFFLRDTALANDTFRLNARFECDCTACVCAHAALFVAHFDRPSRALARLPSRVSEACTVHRHFVHVPGTSYILCDGSKCPLTGVFATPNNRLLSSATPNSYSRERVS